MGSIGITEWILIFIVLGFFAPLTIIILKKVNINVSFWKAWLINFLVIFVYYMILNFIKG